ncbi:MAG: hypothetical protein ACXU86_12460 [Archangium sp.]
MSRRLARLYALAPVLLLLSGCVTEGPVTYVEGGLSPRHFHFYDVVNKEDDEIAGGWRAACLEVGIERAGTAELFYCTLGIEVPIETEVQGELPVDRAQSICASCANQAAKTTLATVTPTSPIGLACEEFRTLYGVTLGNAIVGSRVTKVCRKGIRAVRLTPPRR